MQYYQFRAMNTDVLLVAEGPRAGTAIQAAQSFIEACERRFTRFSETSELAALNRSAGDWFAASPDMTALIAAALDCHRATQGLFDPSILPDLQAAGYTLSFDQLPRLSPDPKPASRLRTASSPFSAVKADPVNSRVRLPAGMQVDLGGIAKGWIAEKAARLMAGFVPVCGVNAGGDLFVIGLPSGQKAWEIGLEDPLDPARDLLVLLVESGAAATSSVAKRVWQQGGTKRHHLIDPRNGEPAESPWLSVTVFAPRAVLAETFAKALLIAGPEKSQSLLENRPDISFLAVDSRGQIWKSPTEMEKIYAFA